MRRTLIRVTFTHFKGETLMRETEKTVMVYTCPNKNHIEELNLLEYPRKRHHKTSLINPCNPSMISCCRETHPTISLLSQT